MMISVIIATYNRCSHLKLALESLLKQQGNGSFEYEVLVIDNNSNDGTKEVVDNASGQWNGRLKYFLEPKQGKSYALNKGINESKGEFIAFTDDDIDADPGWLLNILKCFQEFSCDAVGGRVLPIYPAQTPQWIKDNAIKLAGAVVIYDYGPHTIKLDKSMYTLIGANYAFKRSLFTDSGLFRTDLGPGSPFMGEDIEYIERLLAMGKSLYYCGEALIWHPFDPKRMDLKLMAQWHIALGKFDTQREIQQGQISSFLFAVPRYLIKGIMMDFLCLGVYCFNHLEFYNSWRKFFRKVGMIEEYRNIAQKKNNI